MGLNGTFDNFTAARLAIYVAQKGLSVTGNNIANINTNGYTRQRADLVSLHSAGSASCILIKRFIIYIKIILTIYLSQKLQRLPA